MYIPFESLPDTCRIWVYQANRKFNSQEASIISDTLSSFIEQWNAHGVAMRASFKIQFDQFIVLAADENATSASGCSIDDSVRTIRALGQNLNIDFFDRTLVAFEKQGEIVTIPLGDLKNMYQQGLWNTQSLVFNNLISSKGDLSTAWLKPAGLTWLKRYLPQESLAH